MKEYNIFVNDSRAFYKLAGFCFLVFVGSAILWLVMVGYGMPKTAILIGGVMVLLIPFGVYIWFKRKTSLSARVVLCDAYIEINLSDKTQKIMFNEMKSFSAFHYESNDGDDTASLRIRLKGGKKVRLYASTNICDIEPLFLLCEDFKLIATEHNIASKFWSW